MTTTLHQTIQQNTMLRQTRLSSRGSTRPAPCLQGPTIQRGRCNAAATSRARSPSPLRQGLPLVFRTELAPLPLRITDTSPDPAAEPRAPVCAAVVEELTPETFHPFIQGAGDDVVVVDYHTMWCGPCKVREPDYEILAVGRNWMSQYWVHCKGDTCSQRPAVTVTKGARGTA